MSTRPTIHNIAGDIQTSGTTSQSIVQFTTADNQSYAISAEVTGCNRVGSEGAAYFLRAGYKNIGGTVTQIGTTTKDTFENDADWDAFFTISIDRIILNVQGGTGDTVDWTTSLRVIVSQGS